MNKKKLYRVTILDLLWMALLGRGGWVKWSLSLRNTFGFNYHSKAQSKWHQLSRLSEQQSKLYVLLSLSITFVNCAPLSAADARHMPSQAFAQSEIGAPIVTNVRWTRDARISSEKFARKMKKRTMGKKVAWAKCEMRNANAHRIADRIFVERKICIVWYNVCSCDSKFAD